jgi:hypothetical protein
MVKLSLQSAKEAGVADRAKFVEGDMFAADISRATVLALFLLPDNLTKLDAKFRKLNPGTRIVTNGYRIPGWEELEVGTAGGDCDAWCTAYLYYVPADVAGAWRLPAGDLSLEQEFQNLSGVLNTNGVEQKVTGTVRGERVRFAVGLDVYTGRVKGNQMSGEVSGAMSGKWTATRKK